MRFTRRGEPYRFVGANAWYLAWLGADADFGDRARLERELEALAGDGVTNLRIAASADLSAGESVFVTGHGAMTGA